MKLPQRIIVDYQIITELDNEDHINSKVKIWSRLGYKLHGSIIQDIMVFDEKRSSIVYTQVMVKYGWRWS